VITLPDANATSNATGQKDVGRILCVHVPYYIAARSRFRCPEKIDAKIMAWV
jgi:hypothetical protein